MILMHKFANILLCKLGELIKEESIMVTLEQVEKLREYAKTHGNIQVDSVFSLTRSKSFRIIKFVNLEIF